MEDYTEEELLAFIQSQRSGGTAHRPDDSIADSASKSLQEGVGQGLIQSAAKTEIFIREMLNNVGLLDKKETNRLKKARQAAEATGEKRMEATGSPGLAKAGKFVGEVAPFAAMPAGSLAKLTGSGAIAGAIQDEENRGRGALIGGGLALGTGALLHTIRGKMPEVDSRKVAAFKREGINPTRDQIKKVLPNEVSEGVADDAVRAVVPKDPARSYAAKFANKLETRDKLMRARGNKRLTEALAGKTGQSNYDTTNAKKLYESLRPSLLENEEQAVKTFVNKLDNFFSKPQTLKSAKDAAISKGFIDEQVNSIQRRAKSALMPAAKVKKAILEEVEIQLKNLDPIAHSKYKAGLNVLSKRYKEIGDAELTKALEAGDFDTMITAFKKTSGAQTLAKIRQAVGKDGVDYVQNGVMRRAFERSINKDFVIDKKKFIQELDRIKEGSGMEFGKDAERLINNAKIVFESVKKNPPPNTNLKESLGVIAKVWDKLIQGPAGKRLLLRHELKSPEDLRTRQLINNLIKTGVAVSATAMSTDGKEEEQDYTEEELLAFIQSQRNRK